MRVKLEMKLIYGRILYFPKCHKSKLIAEWFDKKTLSQVDVETLKKLDFEVEVISKNYTTILKKGA